MERCLKADRQHVLVFATWGWLVWLEKRHDNTGFFLEETASTRQLRSAAKAQRQQFVRFPPLNQSIAQAVIIT
jgi:hypothetical protein